MRVHDQIARPVVAVDDGGLVVVGDVVGEPRQQAVHFGYLVGARRLVLAAPAADLARDVAALPSEVGEAERAPLDPMQPRQHVGHRAVDRAPLTRRKRGPGRVLIDGARHIVHHVKGRADDVGVFAQVMHLRHRHVGLGQRREDAVFPLDQMRRRQQHARRLLAQHEAPLRPLDQIGRVGLPRRELAESADRHRFRHVRAEMALQRRLVDAVRRAHGRGRRLWRHLAAWPLPRRRREPPF